MCPRYNVLGQLGPGLKGSESLSPRIFVTVLTAETQYPNKSSLRKGYLVGSWFQGTVHRGCRNFRQLVALELQSGIQEVEMLVFPSLSPFCSLQDLLFHLGCFSPVWTQFRNSLDGMPRSISARSCQINSDDHHSIEVLISQSSWNNCFYCCDKAL